MFISRSCRRAERTRSTWKPEICVLEDRIVPALRGFGPAVPPASVVTHLLVIVPRNVQEGTPTNVIVEALNSKNQVVPGYRGNVQLALGSTDPGAKLDLIAFAKLCGA